MSYTLGFIGCLILTSIVLLLYVRTVKQQVAEGERSSFLPIASGFWCALFMILLFSDTILFSYLLREMNGQR